MKDNTLKTTFSIETNIHDAKKLVERICLIGGKIYELELKKVIPEQDVIYLKQLLKDADDILQPIMKQVTKQQCEHWEQLQTTQQ